MKKRLLFAALFSAALVSCTKDQVVEVQQDEIKFRVATEGTTKAADVYCNNSMPSGFRLWAAYATSDSDQDNTADASFKPYIGSYTASTGKTGIGDFIKNSGNEWVNQTGTRYWPEAANVNFYAVAGGGGVAGLFNYTVDQSGFVTGAQVKDFEVKSDVKQQVDFLYATNLGLNKSTSGESNVYINFRHALSQIVFKAKNLNPNLYIEIEGVSVYNVVGKNTFTYPSASTHLKTDGTTDGNIVDHTQQGAIDWQEYHQGTWENSGTGNYNYTVNFETDATVEVLGNSTTINLTEAQDANAKESNVMLLIPQTVTPWNPTEKPDPNEDDNIQDGNQNAFFMLKCRLYNVIDSSLPITADNLVMIWGNTGNTAKEVAIPVPTNTVWKQGQKYVYTFIFDKDSNGGWDPEPDDDEPKPALLPIKLDVKVDDFTNSSENDVNMKPVVAVP